MPGFTTLAAMLRARHGFSDRHVVICPAQEHGLFKNKSISRMLKKSFYTGCSKKHRCKMREIARKEPYFVVRRV